MCGLPRRGDALRADAAPVLFNSALVVSSGGFEWYVDKHHLYDVDKTWATAGASFAARDDVPGLEGIRLGFGICMDINPWEFEDFSLFELATFHKEHKTQLLVFSSAWCASHPDDRPATRERAERRDQDAVTRDTIGTWLQRLRPLLGSDVVFIAADRVGSEDLSLFGKKPKGEGSTTFVGNSCVLALDEPALLGRLGTEEGLLVVDIPTDHFKAARPDSPPA